MHIPRISRRILLLAAFSGMLFPLSAEGQGAGKVLSVKANEMNEGNDVTVTAEIVPGNDIAQMYLLYRQYGQSEFRETEMMSRTTTATGTIPAAVVSPPFVEYYVLLRLKNGSTETYPLLNPDANPLRVTVKGGSEKDREVIILSPEKYESIPKEDLFFSLSLIYAGPKVKRSATRLIIDGTDVTSNAVFSNDVLTYFPDNFPGTLSSGAHSYSILLYAQDGSIYHTVSGSFTVASEETAAAERRAFQYGVSAQAEIRNEDISAVNTWYNRLTLRLNGGWPFAVFKSYIHLTSEEKKYRQPQDRFSLTGETSWLKIGLGDVYPVFPSLLLDGQRVRGVSGDLYLGALNVNVAYGDIARGIEGTEIARYHKDSLPGGVPPANSLRLSGAYADYYAQYDYGTFKRNIFALRPSFGKGETFRIGLNYLHSVDDKNSIKFGTRPQENVVVGSDLRIGVDNERFLITAQAALSIMNNDITNGNASDAHIDSLFGPGKPYEGDPDVIKQIRDYGKPFITVNENISPLDPRNGGSAAYEAAISLNYFGNYFKASYISRGSQYHSFGQSFLRTDIRGFNIIDRLRLVGNTLFLAGSAEILNDNLDNTKIATTEFSNYNFSVSYYPRFNFPNVSIGIGAYGNSNGLKGNDPDPVKRASAVDNLTTRIFAQLGYDFIYLARHSSSLSVTSLSTDDRTPAKVNVQNTVIAAGLTTNYAIPLQTIFNLTFNFNALPGFSSGLSTATGTANFDYATLSIGGIYRLMEERLRVGATLSPTFGDMKRTLFELTSQYMLTLQHSLIFQFYLINNPENPLSANDTIVSLLYRFDL